MPPVLGDQGQVDPAQEHDPPGAEPGEEATFPGPQDPPGPPPEPLGSDGKPVPLFKCRAGQWFCKYKDPPAVVPSRGDYCPLCRVSYGDARLDLATW